MGRIFRLSFTAVLGFFIALGIVRISGCTPDPAFLPKTSAQATPAQGSYYPSKVSVVDEQFNFHLTTPFLWRSAQPSEEAFGRMKRHGLRTVINLRREDGPTYLWEKTLVEKMGLRYFHFPMEAGTDHDLGQVEEILSVINDPANQPVLIHCAGGKDRTGLVAAIYKIEYTDQSFDDIHREMLMFGYHQDLYPAVLRSIRRWCETHGHQKIAEKISQDGSAVTRS